MRTKQRGYQLPDLTGLFIVLALVCAVGGWLVIEGVLWVASHVEITWQEEHPNDH